MVLTILQTLKEFLPLIHRTGFPNTQLKYISLIVKVKNVIVVKKKCGVKAVSKLAECLVETFKYDAEGVWALLKKNDVDCRVVDCVISLLQHPYHEVRLTVAENIGKLFVNSRNVTKSTLTWQKKMLKNVFLALSENVHIFIKQNDCVTEYFTHVISSVSLISLANIICLSRFWRKKTLFYLIHLAHLKQFKQSEIQLNTSY